MHAWKSYKISKQVTNIHVVHGGEPSAVVEGADRTTAVNSGVATITDTLTEPELASSAAVQRSVVLS